MVSLHRSRRNETVLTWQQPLSMTLSSDRLLFGTVCYQPGDRTEGHLGGRREGEEEKTDKADC